MAIENKTEQDTISKADPVETKEVSSAADVAGTNTNEQEPGEQQPQPDKSEETKDEEPVTEQELKQEEDKILAEPCPCPSEGLDHPEEVEQNEANSKKRSSPLSKEDTVVPNEPPSKKDKLEVEEQ